VSLQELYKPEASHGAATGIVPAAASAEATTTQSQPIAAAETQLDPPASMSGAFALAKVPVSAASAVQPPILPLSTNEALTFLRVKPDIKDMTLDEKFDCLKQCFACGHGVRWRSKLILACENEICGSRNLTSLLKLLGFIVA
jgi:hypothetical protein